MNSIFHLNKIPIISEVFSISSKYTQSMHFNTTYSFRYYLKSSRHSYDENFDSKSTSSPEVNTVDSGDVFGTLKRPLEKKINYKFQNISMKSPNKKIVKVPRKDNSDVFGNLSEKNPLWYPTNIDSVKEDNDQSDDSVIIKNISKRYRSPEKYFEEMKKLVKEKKIKEALDLFVDMKRNYVTPFRLHFTFMIGVCGRIGYTEMAFKLFKQMTDRGFKPTSATLTGLFNSCAESPFPEYGLKKAQFLREKIEMKSWVIVKPTYHSMIKAFGKCGDLKTAFQIVDEMVKAEVKIDASTFNFLLMSCITNKEAGFTYAVEVLRKMRNKKIQPNIFTCNLILRATRDCDVGPENISCLLLQHWSTYSKRPYGFLTKEKLQKPELLKIKSGLEDDGTAEKSSEKSEFINFHISDEHREKAEPEIKESTFALTNIFPMKSVANISDNSPTNLLGARPVNGPEILELVNIKTASDRLALIGGVEGFLKFMLDAKVKPDIKTFTLLLECLPPNAEVEEKLLSMLDLHNVKPDIDFFNMLIRRRNMRNDIELARRVLVEVNKYELTPDIVTFGVLALGCKTFDQAVLLINEMKKLGASPNIEILGTLLFNSCIKLNFQYMKFVLETLEKEDVKPSEKFLLDIEKNLKETKKNIILMEQGKEVPKRYHRENLPVEYRKFCRFYEEWSKKINVEIEQHPWLQYKTDIIDRAKPEQVDLSN